LADIGLDGIDLRPALRLRGAVVDVADGVARVVGLMDVGSDELVRFDSGGLGLAYEIAPEHTGIVLISAADRVRSGDGVVALGRQPALPVGPDLLGRVVDPLGTPLDDGPAPGGSLRPLFREAPALTERAPVDRPVLTGIMTIDAAIPIGRGQRQLILGDRNVGKTSLVLDVIAAQRGGDVACVYVAVGQPTSRVLGVRESLQKVGALTNTVIVASNAAAPPGLQYLAPYAGMAAAEAFREQGHDAIVVFDDLTKHADAYRELALLLGRPPGREAFPGDIFYIHAGLLERATALKGGGSVTALPIVETTDSDISAYIPTNLISITDGQIYLDSARFERNQRPAIDIGRSVSRVGGTAQAPALRAAARNLRITMSRFEALEALTRVGLDVDAPTQKAIERGRIIRETLRQPRFTPRSLAAQILVVTAIDEGWLDGVDPPDASRSVWTAVEELSEERPDLARAVEANADPASWKDHLREQVRRASPSRA
jgi:F-type H+-transporting ATPase subunit alpha